MSKQLVLLAGAIYGFTSVLLGAFGAHMFKSLLSLEKITSFQTAVKYQMYHALLLLLVGFSLSFQTTLEKGMAFCIILGTFLFSVSIYFLSFADYFSLSLKWLGPVTPIGGLFLITGWFLLILTFIRTTL